MLNGMSCEARLPGFPALVMLPQNEYSVPRPMWCSQPSQLQSQGIQHPLGPPWAPGISTVDTDADKVQISNLSQQISKSDSRLHTLQTQGADQISNNTWKWGEAYLSAN